MKTNLYIFAILLATLLAGCKGGSTDQIVQLVTERDSLKQVARLNEIRWEGINEMMNIVNATVDSIAKEEGMLFVSMKDNESTITRSELIDNLEKYESLINQQHKKLRTLEAQLHDDAALDNNTAGVVTLLRAQLAEKDRQIAYLREELKKKDVNIAQLRQTIERQNITISTQGEEIDKLERRSEHQQRAIKAQDDVLNKCYVLIGTKSDLERKGVIKKGKLLPDGALDRSKFACVDIRNWNDISFTAKKVRVLTPMPDSSYEITTDGNRNFTLEVLDPASFWSISNCLIIQTD